MRKLVQWYDSLHSMLRLFLTAICTAIPFYVGAVLSYYVTQVIELKSALALAVHAGTFIVFIGLVVFVYKYADVVREELQREAKNRASAITRAYTFMDRMTIKRLAALQDPEALGVKFVEIYVTSLACIQHIVQSAYETCEASFGHPERQDRRIDFEVTFMTKSYRDGHITIPCWANRDNRAPRSLIKRAQTQDIYDNTVTAEIYREAEQDANPHMHIVEDTAQDQHYHELYPEQKKRIRSTIIFPVLSDSNALLGTLVVHCDQPEFFKKSDGKYWSEVLDVFAKNIALAKARLDRLHELKESGTNTIDVPIEFTSF